MSARTNAEWLSALTSSGEPQNLALSDLRCGSGQRPSLGNYVTGRGPRTGRPPPEGPKCCRSGTERRRAGRRAGQRAGRDEGRITPLSRAARPHGRNQSGAAAARKGLRNVRRSWGETLSADGAAQGVCTDEVPMCSKTNDKCTTTTDCCPPAPGQPANSCLGGYCGFVVTPE
jgi:hypothetical protein